MMLSGQNRWHRSMATYFHTSHPGLAEALRRSGTWVQVSCNLYGGDKARSMASIARAAGRKQARAPGSGYGGHFRAVQGFKYLGGRP
jgi:hypothetical protein